MAVAQLMPSLARAMQVLTDPADCGPVTLALPQDVQTMAHDYPAEFFAPDLHRARRIGADPEEISAATQILRSAKKPLIIAGGGVFTTAMPARDSRISPLATEFRSPKLKRVKERFRGTTRRSSMPSA